MLLRETRQQREFHFFFEINVAFTHATVTKSVNFPVSGIPLFCLR
jgi:hypothetical protein